MSRRNLRVRARTQTLLCASCATLAATALACPAGATTGSHYQLTISRLATRNVTFVNGVYTATGTGAALNVKDLEKALGEGNVEVTTGNGAGGTRAGDIHVDAALRWTGKFALTLDAYHSIIVDAAVSDTGTGALTLTTNDGGSGGTFTYGAGGSITIWGLSNILTIDGQVYTLVGDLPTLASDLASDPAGFYALANSYDAGKDGTYTASPIALASGGTVDGLGNTISNLTIASTQYDAMVGLFAEVSNENIRDIVLSSATVSGGEARNADEYVGALVGSSQNSNVSNVTVGSTVSAGTAENVYLGGVAGSLTGGTVTDTAAAATVTGGFLSGGIAGTSTATVTHATATVTMTLGQGSGGLFGQSYGSVSLSSASGTISGPKTSTIGGLIGGAAGTVSQCFATASATGTSSAGGLIGSNEALVENSYAEGAGSTRHGAVGGLAGTDIGSITSSYAAGPVTANQTHLEGGFIGHVPEGYEPTIKTSYWDLTTSGLSNPNQGVGNRSGYHGLKALTSTQLQSGLPSGFDRKIWAESPNINNGLPYLINNPPQ